MPAIWKLIDVLKEASSFLDSKGIEDARLNAEQLLAQVLKISRVDLYLQFDQPLKPEERNQYKALLRRRAEHEPLQYIIGETEFMSLPFKVTPEVLIPRPETEILVEQVIEMRMGYPSSLILDIGVGSGCIAVSLANYLDNVKILGIDIHKTILDVARQNAELNQVSDNIDFQLVDMTQGLDTLIKEKIDVIVSNPPYISKMEWDSLPVEVKDFEPKHALDGGLDGFQFYHIIAAESRKILKSDGVVIVEVGDKQAEQVTEIFRSQGFQDLQSITDLNQIPRVVIGQA